MLKTSLYQFQYHPAPWGCSQLPVRTEQIWRSKRRASDHEVKSRGHDPYTSQVQDSLTISKSCRISTDWRGQKISNCRCRSWESGERGINRTMSCVFLACVSSHFLVTFCIVSSSKHHSFSFPIISSPRAHHLHRHDRIF